MEKMKKLLGLFCAFLVLAACTVDEGTDGTALPEIEQIVEATASEPAQTEPPTEPPTEPAPTEPEPVAERITEGYEIFLDYENISSYMNDDNHYSQRKVMNGQKLHVASEKPFGALYIEWGVLPGSYELQWDGGSMTCGNENFWHDYIRLPTEVTELYFVFSDEEIQRVCEIQLYTDGTAPDGVQDWMEPCEQADILVFPTHSDDDVLFFGTLIAHYVIEMELDVQTAFMVDHVYQPERYHERLDGLWEMGVRHYPILGSAPDSAETDFNIALNYYAGSNIPQWQVELIRRFQPLVVVGHDPNGEYGNGGHKVNTYYLMQAVEWAADPEMYPESADIYGTWDTPKLYLHYYQENDWKMEVNTPLSKDPEGRTAFEIAKDAYKHHVSQHKWSFRVTQGDETRYYDCRAFGLYRTLVGYDTGADVMENIVVEDWRKD